MREPGEADAVKAVEICVHCKRCIYFNTTIKNEWVHGYGGTWCQDSRGYTAVPLHQATPVYHRTEDIL